ncbi:Nucleotide-binding, alpha-beta plait [Penicillium occitanis (nom. inval.)]|nr:Nucleotide-binding, alpha-beta plait [Penicillium occitanis (nom. inval.)]PCG95151.1 hypothetical protein PENOC_079110 [Penicillium occitanis (nom. inval.)]
MPHSMRYPVEPFIPQSNGSGTPAPQHQQQEEMPARTGSVTPTPRRQARMPTQNGSVTPTPRRQELSAQNGSETAASQPSVIMPATNGSGRSFPSVIQRNGSRTPIPRSSAPQPLQILTQIGNSPPSADASRDTSLNYPVLMTVDTQTYIRFDAASRLFRQPNDNAAPQPPQLNGHNGNWAPPPQANGHYDPFPPQSNGHGDHGFVTEAPFSRPQTAPPPIVSPDGLPPTRDRSDSIRSLEYAFQPLPPPLYYQPGNNQYYSGYQFPVSDPYYYSVVQTQYPAHQFKPTVPSVPWFAPVYLRKTAPIKSDDPEAKLFVGDLPVRMTTEALGNALGDALKERFKTFKEFQVNVTWKSKPGRNGVPKSLPTGWIQFATVFEAAYALDVAKEEGFAIEKRPVRIDRADGKRICRMWPTNPHATPSLDDFKNAIRGYVRHVGRESAYCMLYHVSNKIEMVEKNYGGRIFDVPSVGIVFRWVEDASYSEQKFSKFTYKFRLKIEHVNSGTPGWREGPGSLRILDALVLDTGEEWQEKLMLARRCLRNMGEEFPDGKMARYPERISKKLIPRSILEHPRLKKDVFGFDPYDSLDWLDVHRERPTTLGMAINSKKMGRVNGQTNSHCNGVVSHQTNGETSPQTNGGVIHRINGQPVMR